MHWINARRTMLRLLALAVCAAGATLVVASGKPPMPTGEAAAFRDSRGAYASAAAGEIDRLGSALDAYRRDVGIYPTSRQGLAALLSAPAGGSSAVKWRGPYLEGPVPTDPWGRDYVYVSPGVADSTGYDLHSFGRDGREGGEGEDGDVLSWKVRPTELPAPVSAH